jgi:dimethylglycine dehydrogenase
LHAHGLGLTGLSIAGPKSRELLQKLTDENVSGNALRFMDIRETHLGMIPAFVGRITFTGDLGYEIWVAPEYQNTLYDNIMAAGKDLGLRLYGSHALASLRMEKSFGTWAREFRPNRGPFEAGLGPFVKFDKGDFIGREAALAESQSPLKKKLVTFSVTVNDADVIGDEPIWHEGEIVGAVTSGAYAHNSGASLAMGYVRGELAENTSENAFEIQILGERCPATMLAQAMFDPRGERMRG